MDRAGSFQRWHQLCAWFLAGYTSVSDLSAADREAIIPFMINRIVGQTIYVSEMAARTNQQVGALAIKPIYELAGHVLDTGGEEPYP
jgi:hypothetical protein